jgi:hypothetical protein
MTCRTNHVLLVLAAPFLVTGCAEKAKPARSDSTTTVAIQIPKDRSNDKASPQAPSHDGADRRASSTLVPTAQLTNADRIVDGHFAIDTKAFTETGYANFVFGDTYASLRDRMTKKEADQAQETTDNRWVTAKGDTLLLFHDKRLVGVTKRYYGTMKQNADALSDRFGRADPHHSFDLQPITRSGGRGSVFAGHQLLVRYSCPNAIVYGYISSNGFMSVTAYDRPYLLTVFRRDIEQKLTTLDAIKPVLTALNANPFLWEKIAFPTGRGLQSKFGRNDRQEPIATLYGKKALNGLASVPNNVAINLREYLQSGTRAVTIALSFNNFPDFEISSQLTPTLVEPATYLATTSLGSWTTDHDSQKLNAMLLMEIFPPTSNTVAQKTALNKFAEMLEYEQVNTYSWETKDQAVVAIIDNNTITLTHHARKKID